MKADAAYLKIVRRLLPSPFTIAVLLTFVTFLLAFIFTRPLTESWVDYSVQVLGFWKKGFWELLTFSMQMVLILVLGHTLALSSFFRILLDRWSSKIKTSYQAAWIVCLFAVVTGLINWGLSLILGALFARKIGEHALEKQNNINYPLVGAAGYSGLLVWHGGLSGSAPLKVAEANHFLVDRVGRISIAETLFSPQNLFISISLILLLPLLYYILGRSNSSDQYNSNAEASGEIETDTSAKLERSSLLAKVTGSLFLLAALVEILFTTTEDPLAFIDLNFINFILFGLGILFHGNFKSFLNATKDAVKGAIGIIIQFPIYSGIMGIMKYSGLIALFSGFFVEISGASTFPVFSFISAAIVNFFVPSGGGQWAVQGPILSDAALSLGVPMSKTVMAFSYGDQLTNMIQPFWALPLLGITGLKARDILPYSFLAMLVAVVLFVLGLLIF